MGLRLHHLERGALATVPLTPDRQKHYVGRQADRQAEAVRQASRQIIRQSGRQIPRQTGNYGLLTYFNKHTEGDREAETGR